MKIIDILNKKANGTLENGFKFKWAGYTYSFNEKNGIKDEEGDTLSENKFVELFLDDEVEVIEENKEIEELKAIAKEMAVPDSTYDDVRQNRDKINELVQAVNKLIKERNKTNE